MKVSALFLVPSVAMSAPLAACSIDAVRAADEALATAIVAHDPVTAKSLYAEEFTLVSSHGTRKHADDMLRDVANEDITWRSNATRDVHVIGDANTAVLFGKLQQAASIAGKLLDVELLVTDTWTCRDGRWRLLAGNASRVD